MFKLFLGFFGEKIRKLAILVFIIDCLALIMITLGFYYYLDSFKSASNYSYAPFVVIFSLNLLISCFFFTLTALRPRSSFGYNYYIGIGIMSIANCVAIILIHIFWKQIVTITPKQYVICAFIMFFFNCFICVNSYFLINVSSAKFKEGDAIYAFYTYFTDILFNFWRRLFTSTNKMIRYQRRQNKKMLKEKKELELKKSKPNSFSNSG